MRHIIKENRYTNIIVFYGVVKVTGGEMVRYKYQTHKSNYLKVEVKVGINYQTEDGTTSIHSGVCVLKLVLSPGEHIVSGRYEAGVVDGKPVMGETVFHYCIDAGNFVICDYKFEQKLEYKAPDYYKCLEFRLVKIEKENNMLEEQNEEVLLQVSARYENKYICTLDKETSWLVRGCRNQLREGYEKITWVLSEAHVPVYKKLEEIPQYDEHGSIVGGRQIGLIAINQNTLFYNMVNTSYDIAYGGGSWLDYYWVNTGQNCYKCCATNIGVNCTALIPNHPGWTYKGAHIAGAPNISVPMIFGAPGTHMFNQLTRYCMVPLCAKHNSQGGNFPMFCWPSDGVLPVSVLVLDSFKHNKYW